MPRPRSGARAAPAAAAAAAALVAAAGAVARPRARRPGAGRARGSTRAASTRRAVAAAAEAPAKEAPTPFPRDPVFGPELKRLLQRLPGPGEQPTEEGAIIEALEDVQDLHGYDKQWVDWPRHREEAKTTPYYQGLFRVLRGILRCIGEAENEDLRDAAVELLYSLCVNGSNLTRLPAELLLECGAVGPLCRVVEELADRSALQILCDISRRLPSPMLVAVINSGAIRAAISVLEQRGTHPLVQLAALDVILALSKRAPAKVAQAGAYDAVKIVANPALAPRRNKIMNFLRPLVQHDGDTAPLTNIRIGGLKF